MLKVAAAKSLLAGKFRHGKLFVEETRWSMVDASDKEIRATLLAYVPSHIRIGEGQDQALAGLGLELKGGKLVDLRAPESAPKAKPSPAKEQPKEARAQR